MIWLAAGLGAVIAPSDASLLQAPKPVDFTSWPMLLPSDPAFEGGGWARTIRTSLTVREDGSVQNCKVERSTGHKTLDNFVCAMFGHRARFRPAVWIDGSPSYGVFRFTFKIYRDDRRSSKSNPVDLEVSMDHKAYSGQLPVLVHVVFAVDQDGRTGDCIGDTSSSDSSAVNPTELVPIACEAVIHRRVPDVAIDKSGKPVRSVQNAVVRIGSH